MSRNFFFVDFCWFFSSRIFTLDSFQRFVRHCSMGLHSRIFHRFSPKFSQGLVSDFFREVIPEWILRRILTSICCDKTFQELIQAFLPRFSKRFLVKFFYEFISELSQGILPRFFQGLCLKISSIFLAFFQRYLLKISQVYQRLFFVI